MQSNKRSHGYRPTNRHISARLQSGGSERLKQQDLKMTGPSTLSFIALYTSVSNVLSYVYISIKRSIIYISVSNILSYVLISIKRSIIREQRVRKKDMCAVIGQSGQTSLPCSLAGQPRAAFSVHPAIASACSDVPSFLVGR